MAMLRIQRNTSKGGFQYFNGSELVGTYQSNRFFSIKYQAATYRDGREKYVLRFFDPRTYLFFAVLLLAVLMPEVPQGILCAGMAAGLLVFPRPPAIWANGQFVARRKTHRRFFIGGDCYELCAHTGFKESLIKNGRQVALYQRRTAWGQYDPPYDILYSDSADLDVIILFCIYIDTADAFTGIGRRTAPWKDWVPCDPYPERAEWRP